MHKPNGIDTSYANADDISTELATIASKHINGPQGDALLAQIRVGSKQAADAYQAFRSFIATTFFDDVKSNKVKAEFAADHFAMGDAEYDWALKNNFRID